MALYKWSTKVSWSAWAWFSPENTGTTGQVLTKTSTWYSYQDAPTELPSSWTNWQYLQKTAIWLVWADIEALPSGWTTGQVLKKTQSWAEWADESELPSWWSAGNVLKKTINATEWWTVSEVPSGWTEWQILTKTSNWYWWNDSQWWSIEEMTQTDYDELPSTKLTDNTWRLIYE